MAVLLLLATNTLVHPMLDFNTAAKFEKVLPSKNVLFKKIGLEVPLNGKIKSAENEIKVAKKLEKIELTCTSQPDIFIFILESLREDFIQEGISPTLHKFKMKNIHFETSHSSSNTSQLCWSSVFNSMYPIYWQDLKDKDTQMGSIPLNILKKMGYKLHLFTTPSFNFYDMGTYLFGKNNSLLDTYVDSEEIKKDWHDKDRFVSQKMVEKVEELEKGQNVYIIFLSGTHYPYYFDEDSTKFKPISGKNMLSHLNSIMCSKEYMNDYLSKLKNRYRNSIFEMDKTFANIFRQLKKLGRFKDSLVVITGDHGEEFMEHGRLFHGAHLNKQQVSVPLYYKLTKETDKKPSKITSQIDIFPTIFDQMGMSEEVLKLFDGKSIFNREKPYAISFCAKGTKNPSRFCICDNDTQITAAFDNEKNVFNSKKALVLSCKNYISNEDVNIEDKKEMLEKALNKITKSGLK